MCGRSSPRAPRGEGVGACRLRLRGVVTLHVGARTLPARPTCRAPVQGRVLTGREVSKVTFDARVVRVLIASPGDTGAVRKLLREMLED